MWIAQVLCSGQECTEEIEVVVESLDELAGLACDCGYGFMLVRVSEVELV